MNKIYHRGRKMDEEVANFVYNKFESEEKSLTDFCIRHGILPSVVIVQVCMHRLTATIKCAICRELGFNSWEELKDAALSTVEA